jgi:hypothetical protein
MYFNNLPLRIKLNFFFVAATILSFIVHYAASFSTDSELVFLTIGIMMAVLSAVLLSINLVAYWKERQ